jgi:hypothetical protein
MIKNIINHKNAVVSNKNENNAEMFNNFYTVIKNYIKKQCNVETEKMIKHAVSKYVKSYNETFANFYENEFTKNYRFEFINAKTNAAKIVFNDFVKHCEIEIKFRFDHNSTLIKFIEIENEIIFNKSFTDNMCVLMSVYDYIENYITMPTNEHKLAA